MNIEHIKSIDIVSYLASIGVHHQKTQNNNFWYCSPIRTEKTPSFKVNAYLNRWYDYGIGEGGNIIDLVCKLNNVDFKDALDILQGKQEVKYRPVPMASLKNDKSMGLDITNIMDVISDTRLMLYLKQRGICYNNVKNCIPLKQVQFTSIKGNEVITLGFKNDSGGLELRNNFIKLSTSPKDISSLVRGCNKLIVFEGFMDYLSALSYYADQINDKSVIVLNGVCNVKKVVGLLSNYKEVKLFLDNDKAGIEATNLLMKHHNNIVNQSLKFYPNHKDFNDFILNIPYVTC